MLTAHRIRLDPNKVQATYLARAAGTARFAYSSTATACGGEGAGLTREREAKPAPVKQESNGRQL